MVKKIQIESKLGELFPMYCTADEHRVCVDHPKAAGGQAEGASPIQYLLIGLAGCLSSVAKLIAKQQNIPMNGITLHVEGELDPAGYMGEPTEHRVGLMGIRVRVAFDADLSPEKKKRFLDEIDRRCPVSETLQNGTAVSFEVV
jgi:uncharacterized OsmC-like protein